MAQLINGKIIQVVSFIDSYCINQITIDYHLCKYKILSRMCEHNVDELCLSARTMSAKI